VSAIRVKVAIWAFHEYPKTPFVKILQKKQNIIHEIADLFISPKEEFTDS
jgi:hypothetical protein